MSMDEGEGLEGGGDARQLAASAAYPADGAATRGSLPRRSISGANPTLAEIKRVRDALSRRARMDAKPQAATSHLVPALVGCMGIVQALAGEAPPIAGATSLALGCLVAGCVSAALGVFLCMLPLLHAPGPPRGDTPGAALLWLASVRTLVFFSLLPLDHQPTNADTPCAMLSLHCGWLMRPTTLSLLCWLSHLAIACDVRVVCIPGGSCKATQGVPPFTLTFLFPCSNDGFEPAAVAVVDPTRTLPLPAPPSPLSLKRSPVRLSRHLQVLV
jgi:hypothetical protein